MRFVGIDLAWSPRNDSGGAVLSASGKLLAATAKLREDGAILDFVAVAIPPGNPGLVAVDAPLAVPNDTGGRTCDRQVAAVFGRFEAAPYPANRKNLDRYGGLRAEAIRQRLQVLGFRPEPCLQRQAPTRQVIEVFPHPATVSLFHLERTLKYKSRPQRDYPMRWQELARLRDHLASLNRAQPPLLLPPDMAHMPIKGLRGRRFKETENLLDAVVCAYSALFAWHHGPRGYALYGDASEGHILVPMTRAMWQRIKGRRVLFLDRDGTLNRSHGNRPPNRPVEVVLLPGMSAELHRRASLGWRIVIVSNQGGVAFGYQTEAQAWAIHQAVLEALPVEADASYLCFHHPGGAVEQYAMACPNGKPAPGALLAALARFEAQPQDCLFVGDQDTDRLAAEAAGVPFQWVSDWIGGTAPPLA